HLAVEISDSSLRIDKTTKLALYAKASVPEYWIINLRARAVEVHRKPDGAKEIYEETFIRGIGEKVSIENRPEAEFAVADFFGAGRTNEQNDQPKDPS